jgi:PAS domain S-box-containing protein
VLAFAGADRYARWQHLDGPLVRLDWLHGAGLVVTLLALTCASELVAVRLRHRDTVEELTLLDSTVLLNVLLLPPSPAVAVSLAGVAVAYAVRRRALIKSVFNIGTYAAAGSVLAVLLRMIAGSDSHFALRLAVATMVGAAGFVIVNVGCMSLLLSSLGAGSVGALLRQDLRLTLFTAGATAAMSATVVTIAVSAPIFLPFTALPTAAITFAYRAAATESEQRQRSVHVLAFSRVLAGGPSRDVAIERFLRLARDGFFADHALAVFDGGEIVGNQMVGNQIVGNQIVGNQAGDRGAGDLVLALHARCTDGGVILDDGLPPGWAQAMAAPLEADATRIGTVVVGWTRGDRRRARDLAVFASLASSLAVALSRAQHVARLVEETSKLRAVLDQSSDGILVLDGVGRVTIWNPAVARLSGHAEEHAVGRSLGELLDGRDLDGDPVDAFDAGAGLLSPDSPRVTVELQMVRSDGQRRSVRCAHAGIFDDEGRLVRDVVNVHDLTRERQADRLKSDFIATVSHELRTPVIPIKGYAELLRARWQTLPEAKRVKALDAIADRAAHLGRLVEDLLLASRIDADTEPARTIVTGSVDLNVLVSRAAEDFPAARARLQLRPAPGAMEVRCDRTRTVQILTNLVSNALKYSPDDLGVDIVVGQVAGAGQVSVTDHGRGIPGDQLDLVFEKFHRVEDPMVTSTGGSGLGLYIARHLARAMDGELSVVSALGVGSTFVLRLPLAAATG